MSYEIDGRTNGPAITWPGRARIAVMVTFDFDAEYLRMSRAASKGTTIGFTDYSRGQYGPREGLKRCLDMLDTHDIKSTFFVPGIVAEKYTAQVESIHARGHEIACHGYMHESVRGISAEEETEILEKSEAILKRITGRRPVGHRGPESIIHPFTPELLELPCDITMDDFTYFYFTFSDPAVRSMYTNREVFGNWKDEFDGLVEEGNKIFILKLHPQMIGRASRIAALGNFIAYMKRHGGWITTCEEAARYVLAQAEANQENPEKGGAAL